jgi:hypothetical protein
MLQIKTPLEWPESVAPTERLMRTMSDKFPQDMTEHSAVVYLEDEINGMMGVDSATLSADALNINSSLPTQYLSNNTGACLKLNIRGHAYFLACDKWQKLAHNLYVLHLALRHLKQIEAWGLGDMQRLMAGFSRQFGAQAQASGGETDGEGADSWQAILGLGPTATLEDANTIYRHRAMKIGESDPEALQRLNLAIQQAREALKR